MPYRHLSPVSPLNVRDTGDIGGNCPRCPPLRLLPYGTAAPTGRGGECDQRNMWSL